jgi:hypothetical protein
MTNEQYTNAENDLVERLQTMREAEMGARSLVPKSPNKGQSDSDDDVYEQPVSSEQQAAMREWVNYCRIVKRGKNFPKKYKKGWNYLEIGEIKIGQPEEPGEDLEASPPFIKCNLADFMKEGYFDLVLFLKFNKQAFPYIYKLACCLAPLRTNEVGCERFFSIAGYVSNPRRSRLNVRHYESIAMLKRNMQKIYINEDWVVHEYMTLEKSKGWDKMDTNNDKLVTDLETELYANDLGVPIPFLPNMEDHDDQEVFASGMEHDNHELFASTKCQPIDMTEDASCSSSDECDNDSS